MMSNVICSQTPPWWPSRELFERLERLALDCTLDFTNIENTAGVCLNEVQLISHDFEEQNRRVITVCFEKRERFKLLNFNKGKTRS